MTETNRPSEPHDWTECPPGEISRMVAAGERARRRRLMQYAGAAAGCALLLSMGALAISGYLRDDEAPTVRLTCKECIKLFPAYLAGKLSHGMAEHVSTHLDRCPPCRDHYERLLKEHGGEGDSQRASHVALRP